MQMHLKSACDNWVGGKHNDAAVKDGHGKQNTVRQENDILQPLNREEGQEEDNMNESQA